MQTKEEKICSFTQNGTRLQLIKIKKVYETDYQKRIDSKAIWIDIKYQVRVNRKIIDTSMSEYQMRKLFATYCQNIVLQLKIY